MNTIIKNLKYQAEELAYEEHMANCRKNNSDPSKPHANALNLTFEKFAKLIVQKCIAEIHVADVGNLHAKAFYLDKVAEHIEKHFDIN